MEAGDSRGEELLESTGEAMGVRTTGYWWAFKGIQAQGAFYFGKLNIVRIRRKGGRHLGDRCSELRMKNLESESNVNELEVISGLVDVIEKGGSEWGKKRN